MKMEKVGELAFLACVVIAVLAGIVGSAVVPAGTVLAVLIVLGLIVGFLNVSEKETTPFLIAAIALIIAATASFSAIPTVGSMIDGILGYIAAFVAPAAVIVALKAVYALASKK